jgi:hypothetical protein
MSNAIGSVNVAPVGANPPDPQSGIPACLLPEPAQPFCASVGDDAMSALYTAIAQQQQNQLSSGESEVHANTAEQQQALARQRQAIAQAERDQPHGFLNDLEKIASDVAKVAAIVGSVAITVATAGAGSPILVATAIALSIGGAVVQETQCFGKASEWIGLGMEVGGAGVGVFASLGATGVSAGMKFLADAGRCTLAGSGVAKAVSGGAQVAIAFEQRNVQLDQANATDAQHDADRAQRFTNNLLDDLAQQQKQTQSALGTLVGAWQTQDQIAVTVASSIKG